jgi:hypothetical protein
MLIKVRKFLTDAEMQENPVPFRTMRIMETKKETNKAVLVVLQGTPIPQSECVHCGRKITHPQSLHFGIGSTCIQKYPQLLEQIDYNEIEQSYENLKNSMEKITWEGWLPKSSIEKIPEDYGWEIVFKYNGQQFRTVTKDVTKYEEIYSKADEIVSDMEVEM